MSTAAAKDDNTGSKPADPYTANAKDDAPLKDKVQELNSLMKSCQFAMMTTRTESTGLLTSRVMALAATVSLSSRPG